MNVKLTKQVSIKTPIEMIIDGLKIESTTIRRIMLETKENAQGIMEIHVVEVIQSPDLSIPTIFKRSVVIPYSVRNRDIATTFARIVNEFETVLLKSHANNVTLYSKLGFLDPEYVKNSQVALTIVSEITSFMTYLKNAFIFITNAFYPKRESSVDPIVSSCVKLKDNSQYDEVNLNDKLIRVLKYGDKDIVIAPETMGYNVQTETRNIVFETYYRADETTTDALVISLPVSTSVYKFITSVSGMPTIGDTSINDSGVIETAYETISKVTNDNLEMSKKVVTTIPASSIIDLSTISEISTKILKSNTLTIVTEPTIVDADGNIAAHITTNTRTTSGVDTGMDMPYQQYEVFIYLTEGVKNGTYNVRYTLSDSCREYAVSENIVVEIPTTQQSTPETSAVPKKK